jgi:hypothetical protein
MSNNNNNNNSFFSNATEIYDIPRRHVSAQLGINRFPNANKFINRFYPREWKVFTLTYPEHYLVQQNNDENLHLYAYDQTFADLVFNCLLKVSREACCLITGQSPMIPPGSTFSFDTHLPEDRLHEIGGFPECIPEVNRDGPGDNLMNGVYPFNDALTRCQILQKIGKEVILFIDRAYNLKGNQTSYANGWNFEEVLSPATDYFLNACTPGNAKIFDAEANDLDSILSDSDHLDRASPSPHDLRSLSPLSVKINSPTSTPMGEAISDSSENILKNFLTFYKENSEETDENKEITALNAVKTDSPNINVTEFEVMQPNDSGQKTSSNFVRTQLVPKIKDDTHVNEVHSTALIPHPIYGRNAQNSLIKYTPFYPDLFLK